MRQTGFLAASAAYALTHNFPLLSKVHALTKRLEDGLEVIGANILSRAETCMVSFSHTKECISLMMCQLFYDPSSVGVTYDEIAERGSALSEPLFLGGSRLVVHIQTSDAAVDDFLEVVRQLAEEKRKAGFVRPERQPNGAFKDVYVRRDVKATN